MIGNMNPRFIKFLKTAVIAVTLLAVFYLGAVTGQAQLGTRAATNPAADFNQVVRARVVEINTVQYIEKPAAPADEIIYVEPAGTTHAGLRNFNDLEELKLWLENVRNTDTIRFQYPDAPIDCDDYALELQQRALEDGYLLSFQIIEPIRYNALFQQNKIPLDTLHAINLAVIGNSAYFIEPQTGETVFIARID